MRRVAQRHLVVAQLNIRMMILAVADPRGGVHECRGFVVILEIERTAEFTAGDLPAGDLLEQIADGGWFKFANAAFAGLAPLGHKIGGHGGSFRSTIISLARPPG